MIEPILKFVDRAESLEQLRDMIEDDITAAALYDDMDDSALETLLQQAMIYANLEGRSMEDAGH